MAKKKRYGFGAALGRNGAAAHQNQAPPTYGFGGALGANGAAAHQPQAPPPAVAPQPIDPQFEASRIAGGRQLQVGNAMDAWQTANLDYDSGFGTDQSNPYSQAKLLEESYKRSKLGTTNNYASSGQLHSGAYGRMQGENDRNYSIGVHQGKLDLARGTQGIAFGGLERSAEYGMNLTQADWDALMNSFTTKYG